MWWQNILTIIILDNMNIVSRLKYITRVVFALKDFAIRNEKLLEGKDIRNHGLQKVFDKFFYR